MTQRKIFATLIALALAAFAQAKPMEPAPAPTLGEPQVVAARAARADTLFLFAETGPGSFGSPGTDSRGFTFDFEGGPAQAGWLGLDLADKGAFWHVASTDICAGTGTDMSQALPFDTGDAVNDFALWCGTVYEAECWELNDWIGYGNDWDQLAILDLGPQVADSVTIRYTMSWHIEEGPYYPYERVSLEIWNGDEWMNTITVAISGPFYEEIDWTFPAWWFGDGDWRLAFRFESDGGWSDEDGQFDSDVGAVWVDNIEVIADETTIFAADFEDGLVPPEISFESVEDSAGDFAQLHQGLYQGIADPTNNSFVWAFFDSLTPAYGSPGHDFGIVTGPPYLENAIESPPLTVDASGAPLALTQDTQILLSFDVYRDLVLDGLIFYRWEVWPVMADGADCPGSVIVENAIYYGQDDDWLTHTLDATLLIQDYSAGQPELVEALIVRLVAVDMCGSWCNTYGDGLIRNQTPYIDNVCVMVVDTVTDITPHAPKPMLAAHPNPFNPSTRVDFAIETDGHVDLAVYDITGRRLRTLVSQDMAAGAHDIEWNGRDDAGRELAGGVYLLRLMSGATIHNEKLVLLK